MHSIKLASLWLQLPIKLDKSFKMVIARKYVVKNRFVGLPKHSDFEIIEHELPQLKDGEVLVKTEWVSVDPYLRVMGNNYTVPYDQFGYHVGVVVESKDPYHPVGCRVVSHTGWCDYCILSKRDYPKNEMYKIPDLDGLPTVLAIGAVGMPGAAAYFGFLEICKPQAGETVVVNSAAGAVGSIVAQIAKIKGCKVIAFVDSDAKVEWLVMDFGFEYVFNINTVDIHRALDEAAPDGVEIYFDNVGGELSSKIIEHMKPFGRISVSGFISTYDEDPRKALPAAAIQRDIVLKRLTMKGWVVVDWLDRWAEAFYVITQWIRSGKLIARNHVTEGFENVVDAFIGMLSGKNIGKAVVKV